VSAPKRLARRAVERVLDLADERRRLDERTAPAAQAAQRTLFLEHRRRAAAGDLPQVWDTGYRVFSQFDEDGLLVFLLAAGALRTRRVLDLGAGDGVAGSNSANLLLSFGFHGLLVDADPARVEHARRFYREHPDTRERPPAIEQAFLTRETVNELVVEAQLEGEIDLLSIDVDGNDYWLWDALEAASPRLVVVEAHTELELEPYVMPYRADFNWRAQAAGEPLGASVPSLVELGERLGYRLVGANMYGFNLLFAREDVAPAVPAIPAHAVFRHGSYPAALRDRALSS
jgi:predicted O-methyltransferase YrrM